MCFKILGEISFKRNLINFRTPQTIISYFALIERLLLGTFAEMSHNHILNK